MGYNTWFYGAFSLDKPLKAEHKAYLEAFARMPHVRWKADLLEYFPDPVREAVGLPVGIEGCYFTASQEVFDPDTWEIKHPLLTLGYIFGWEPNPAGIPNARCQWVPSEDGTKIEDVAEKFRDYIPWLQFLLDHFLVPWGYALNGRVNWQGEHYRDRGTIVVDHNVITIL